MNRPDEDSPLVSIVVPGAGAEWRERLANASCQTWPRCEIVPVELNPKTPDLTSAINEGFNRSEGSYVTLLLPGRRYSPEKTQRQIDFVRRFDLWQMPVYCRHAIFRTKSRRSIVAMALPDPSEHFARLFEGLPLEPASLLIPRSVIAGGQLLVANRAGPALLELCFRLSRGLDVVGMHDALVDVLEHCSLPGSARDWRSVYAHYQSDYLNAQQVSVRGASVSRAIANRLAARRVGAALDLYLASSARGGNMALLRDFANRVPTRFKRATQSRRCAHRETTLATAKLDFDRIYASNGFRGTESRSGAGSTLFQTRAIRRELPLLLRELRVASMLDIPCGDVHWMQHVDLGQIAYIGADIVSDLVKENARRNTAAGKHFVSADVVRGPLPDAELIFCRDCLVHLPLADAVAACKVAINGSARWLLTTTFLRCKTNRELDDAGWRPLNLALPPFNLGAPQLVIDEKCTEAGGAAEDKALGLWNLADIRRKN